MDAVTLADAKTHLSELVERVAAGESVNITRRGIPVAQLTQISAARRPVDVAALRAHTRSMPPQSESAGDFMRGLREDSRY